MFTAALIDDVNVVLLQPQSPACKSSGGILENGQPAQRVVIRYYGEGTFEEVRSKFTDSPDDSKTLLLGRRVVLFGSCQRPGCAG
ncbi:hypothetical protein AVEN_110134-1 [Araneus ventricosus]|uniref:Uncharacterized protein n=1 Tax=Araneus ventricosus TaxID=182803 RepID=A0A4Y2J1E8_ARAVE|nr:hypothetical protein AVEN_110134-1 [Araneus ventricosus]